MRRSRRGCVAHTYTHTRINMNTTQPLDHFPTVPKHSTQHVHHTSKGARAGCVWERDTSLSSDRQAEEGSLCHTRPGYLLPSSLMLASSRPHSLPPPPPPRIPRRKGQLVWRLAISLLRFGLACCLRRSRLLIGRGSRMYPSGAASFGHRHIARGVWRPRGGRTSLGARLAKERI